MSSRVGKSSLGLGHELAVAPAAAVSPQVTKHYAIAGQRVAMERGDDLQYILTDHLGSVVALTDGSGNLVAGSQQRYLPFGQPRLAADSPTDFTFTGQRALDAVGLMDYNARWYDAGLGRFTQPDTIIPDLSKPQLLNRYSYTANNPVIYTDSSGHFLDLFLDIASLVIDVVDIAQNGLNWENGLALAADVASAVIPFATGGGTAVRALSHVDDAVDLVSGANKAQNAISAASHVDDAADAARGIGKAIDNVDDIPNQLHHIASNKSPRYTPQFDQIAKKYDLDLDQPWNKVSLPHQGRHPNAYHEWVLDGMRRIDTSLAGCRGNCAGEFIDAFSRNIMRPVIENPSMLRKRYWN